MTANKYPPAKPLVTHATRQDVPVILSLIRDLAEHQSASDIVQATEESLLATLCFAADPFSPPSGPGYAKTLLLRLPSHSDASTSTTSGEKLSLSALDAKVVGMAIYFNSYSTWLSAPGIHLEDLYVSESYRGRGYGVMLIKALAQETVRIGGKRLEWSCKTDNHPSLQFYRGLGAEEQDEWVSLRVDGDVLQRLDKEASREFVMSGI